MPLRCSAMLHYLILTDHLMPLFSPRRRNYSRTREARSESSGAYSSLAVGPLLLFLQHDSAQPHTPRSRRRPGRIITTRSGSGSSGSYFHFSAGAPAAAMIADGEQIATTMWGAGWRALRGYDYLDAAEDAGKDIATKVGDMAKKKAALRRAADRAYEKVLPRALFVVQADRAYDVSSSASAGARMDAALWNAASMDEDDKRMCATRLMECLERYEPNDEMRRAALGAKAAANLPPLYETLKPMAVVIASPLLAQFAANVAPKYDPSLWRPAIRAAGGSGHRRTSRGLLEASGQCHWFSIHRRQAVAVTGLPAALPGPGRGH